MFEEEMGRVGGGTELHRDGRVRPFTSSGSFACELSSRACLDILGVLRFLTRQELDAGSVGTAVHHVRLAPTLGEGEGDLGLRDGVVVGLEAGLALSGMNKRMLLFLWKTPGGRSQLL